jgi:vancomycin resistance protein YoaR
MLFQSRQDGEKKASWRWLLYLAAVFFILSDALAAGYFIFQELYKDKIYPNVWIGQINLGGKTTAEAKKIIETKINDYNQNGIMFKFDQNTATITPIIASFNGDIAHQVITFDSEETLNNAFGVGRNENFQQNLIRQLEARLFGRRVQLSFQTDDQEIEKMLKNNFDQFHQPPENAKLIATTTTNYSEITFKIEPEKNGFNLDYAQAVKKMKENIGDLKNYPIRINILQGLPLITKNECMNIEAQARQFLNKAELTLTFQDKKWLLAKQQIAGWLTLSQGYSNNAVIDLNNDKIKKYIEENIAPQIEIAQVSSRFEIKDSRVLKFTAAQDGRKINMEKTLTGLKSGLFTGATGTMEIAVETIKSDTQNNDSNNFGITEIIGTGHSNFAGSPKNRIHNIGVGAAAMNGLLIAPGEEFSTDKALGLVDASTGYLPEMTIMGDKTVPQYGGGLCQIGTTMFRAALASGFPITARQPHSYRVVYYEPAGTDATIYQPWPDLRFINDSPNYVLIQTHISGNDIYFDFWGTKDGRVVEETDPTIYNIVKPGPTKIIETLDLPPGQKKCTERAHNGADAFFDYKVTYPDGAIKEKRFKSHYVPWREVCLLGVSQLSASSTPTVVK